MVLYFFASEPYLLYFQVESALQELIRCTALARIVYGDGHWKLAETYANLAQGYFELKGNGTGTINPSNAKATFVN